MDTPFTLHSSSKDIEDYLRGKFRDLNWIGELDLSLDKYKVLGRIIRDLGGRQGGKGIVAIPRLMFITSLVFTARYAEFADDETPSFWRPYARMVWKRDDADQNFQSDGRDRFREVRAWLEDEYDFYFPHKIARYDQDVVGGIYMHAILPHYLEDDFAQWIVNLWHGGENWARSTETPLRTLIANMRDHRSLTYMGRRLRNFIERDDTCETAARLVQKMASAADEYANGIPRDEIAEMLSLVERAIWRELVVTLDAEITSQPRQHRRGPRSAVMSLTPTMDLDRGAFAVQITNLRIDGNSKPDRIVWAPTREALPAYEQYTPVNPWKQDSDWLIDTAFVSGIKPTGYIAVVDETDSLLVDPKPVLPLPSSSVLFFRVTANEQFALLVDPENVRNGEYIIASQSQVTVKAGRGMLPMTKIATLDPVGELFEYPNIERYALQLPALITSGDGEISLRAHRGSLSGTLEGAHLPGLVPRSLGVFTKPPRLRLFDTAPLLQETSGFRLRLTPECGEPVEMKLSATGVERDGDDVLVDLADLITKEGGLYSLMVFQQVAHVLPEMLRFAILPPGISVQSPASDDYYSIDKPPVVIISGISREHIQLGEGGRVSQSEDGITVTWQDPTKPVRLQLALEAQWIPLEWKVTWHHAWVEPSFPEVNLENLDDMALNLLGGAYQDFWLQVGVEEKRMVRLSARGLYQTTIARDPLKDMLRTYPASRAEVIATDGRSRWHLFTFVQNVPNTGPMPPLVMRACCAARNKMLGTVVRKRQQTQNTPSSVLLALPPRDLAKLNLRDGGPLACVLNAMQSAISISKNSVAPGALPDHIPLKLELAGCKQTLTVEADALPGLMLASSGKANLVLEEHTSDGRANTKPVELALSWQPEAESGIWAITFQAANPNLRLCSICGTFFVETITTRIQHSHGKGWGTKHNNLSTPLSGRFQVDYEKLFARWQPNFISALDRDVIKGYRIHPDRRLRFLGGREGGAYTVEGYRYAVAEWAQHLSSPHDERHTKLNIIAKSKLVNTCIGIRRDLVSRRNGVSSPALQCLISLLEALPPRADDLWYAIDLTLTTAAILVRAIAHGFDPELFADYSVADDDLLDLFENAIVACPRLLTWAFAWAELYFANFREQSQDYLVPVPVEQNQ